MKRSPLKRTGWPSPRTKRLVQKAGLRRVGKRAERRREALAEFRRQVLLHAITSRGWLCERCGEASKGNLDPHHIWTVGRGGPDEGWNGAAVCRPCHREIHNTSDPEWLASSDTEALKIRARLDSKIYGPEA